MLEVLDKIRELAKRNRIEFTYHARLRMYKRGISAEDIRECVLVGMIVESHPNDSPYPSYLLFLDVYGPRQSLNNPYTGVCAIFSARIKNEKPPLIFEDSLQSRDFVSVHDVVEANVLAMESHKADYEIFNVGTGKATNIFEIALALIKLYNKELKPEITNKYRAGDIRHCFADISKIKNKFGYEPRVEIQEGMKKLVEWGEKEEAVDKFGEANEELLEKGLVEK